MLRAFLRHYFELPQDSKNVVCLGGGVGTSQVLKGLRSKPYNLTSVVSMADDGGSAGRLRRAFSVPPPGDLVNCLAALSDEESIVKQLFLYRFKGARNGKDTDLSGQKLGNLIFVALSDMYKGNFARALEEFSKIISPRGLVLPATLGDVNIWALTSSGKKVSGEKNIDLGKYPGKSRSLKQVFLQPEAPKAYMPTVQAIKHANAIIVGPGDLFSTVLPVLIVPQIKQELKKSNAIKILVINVANKPFETTGFKVSTYIKTIEDHLGGDVFNKIIVNTNTKNKIPSDLNYTYVEYDREKLEPISHKIIEGDFVSQSYPLYHDSDKIGQIVEQII